MVIEYIVEAIHAQERNGALRHTLVILCSEFGARTIIGEMSTAGVQCCFGGASPPPCRVAEKWLGRETVVEYWRGEILGVPLLADPNCPADYWRVERLHDVAAHLVGTPGGASAAHPYPMYGPIQEHDPPREKPRCPLCGKESDRPPTSLYGMKVVGCSCVDSFAGGRCAGVMIDDKQRREAIEQATRDCADALVPALRNVQRAEPFSVKYKGAPQDKQARIDLVNDAFREAYDIIKRSGERWSDAVLPDDDWSKQASKEREEVKQARASEHDARKAFLSLYVRGQEHLNTLDSDRRCSMGAIADPKADAAARAEWSRQLREKQAEARRKEREQVVVDIDWD